MKPVWILAAVVLTAACTRSREAPPAPVRNEPRPVAQRAAPRNAPALQSYSEIVDKTTPAVVTIRSARRARAPQQFPFQLDPLFEEFFGRRAPREAPERQQLGLGSGVIVSADGYILTNHHVIDGAEEITIEMVDRETFKAELIGSDPPSDLAVLRAERRTGLPRLDLGNSDEMRIGDVVLAIGNPLGIGQTVTMGIISAKGRATGLSDGSFEDFLQTDAAINRGNSGGALINTNGELVGINSQILSPTGAYIGIGFAIPSNMAKSVMDQLVSTGRVRRGQLGITIQPVTAEIAEKLKMDRPRGVLVREVSPGGPAQRAGLRSGDVILALNGTEVNDSNALRIRVASTPPGTEVTVKVLRDGREQDLRVRLGEFRP